MAAVVVGERPLAESPENDSFLEAAVRNSTWLARKASAEADADGAVHGGPPVVDQLGRRVDRATTIRR